MKKIRKQKYFLFKIIATAVLCVMVFNFYSPITFAKLFKNQNEDTPDVITKKDLNIVGEDVAKRTLNEKHFILEDGTIMATLYPDNVHYKENGVLKDINNKLREIEDKEDVATDAENSDVKEENKIIKEKINNISSQEILNQLNEIEIQNNKNVIENNINIEKNQTEDNKIKESNTNINDNKFLTNNLPENIIANENAIKDKSINNQINTENVIVDKVNDNILKKEEIIKEENNIEESLNKKALENIDNSFKVKFAKKSNKNKLITIKNNGETIKWSLKNANKVNANIKENVQANKDIYLTNIVSTVKYENILNSVDIEYNLISQKLKENIILKSKDAINSTLEFEFNVGNLLMELDNDNNIIIKDIENEVKYTIQKPYMYDSSLNFSDDIKLQLDKSGKKYIVKLIPNKEWLLSKDIKYPVTIDPTINTPLSATSIQDTFIYNGDTNNNNRYQAHILRVGSNKYLKNPTRTLLKFDLPRLNSGDQVVYALLDICSYPDTNEWTPSNGETCIDIHRMNENWNARDANWNNANQKYNSKIEDFVIYKYDTNEPAKFYYFDITAIVKDWYTTGNNYGLMLKDHVETYNANKSDAYFFASDINGAYENCRPMVQIVYRNQTGIEEYLSYHTQDIGRAGNISVNDYNGNLTLKHEDIATPGNRLPVQMTHVYNTNDKDLELGYGKGFRLNLSQEITLTNINNKEYAVYVDEDGTRVYLEKKGDTYRDEDGIGLILTKSGDNFIMSDKNNNKLTFIKRNINGTDKWHLKEVKDADGNKITLTLNDGGEFKIIKVDDASGGYIQCNYSESKLSSIVDQAGRKISYQYTNGNLTKITYQDGKNSSYEYDNNKLITVKNIDNSYVKYEYYNANVNRVKKIVEYSSNNQQGNSLEISYGNNATVYKDNQGYSNLYTFDDYGRKVSIADFGKENNIDGAYGGFCEYGTSGGEKNKLQLESNLTSIKEMPNNLIKNAYFDNGITNWMKNSNCESTESIIDLNNNNVFKFQGDPVKSKNIRQEVNVTGNAGDIYNISGWVKTNSVPNRDDKSTRITIAIVKNDDSKVWKNILVNTDSSGWQFISKQIIMPSAYKRIDVYLVCCKNANETYFDNIGLYKDISGNSYTYDSNGNIISSKDQASNNSTYAYNVNNNLSGVINPSGGKHKYEYSYNNPSRLLKSTNVSGNVTSYNYDNYGNITKTKIEENSKSDIVQNNSIYYFKFANNQNYFDIDNFSHDNGGNLHLWCFNDGDNQKYKIETISQGYVRIHPIHDESMSIRVNLENNNIDQWKTYDHRNEQKWKFIDNGDGSYRIVNKEKGDNYCITAVDNNTKPGTEVILKEWTGSDTQKIYINKINGENNSLDDNVLESSEIYYIKSKRSGLYLEQQSNSVGSKIIQNRYIQGKKSQLWKITRISNKLYRISNLESKNGNIVDVSSASNTNENDIQMYENTFPNNAQEWKIVLNDDGTYSMYSNLAGKDSCITVYHDSQDEGSKMVIYETTGGDNQRFYLEKANLFEIESGATYKIKGVKSGLYLGVNGGNVELRKQSNTNQEWIITNLNNGYYKLKLKGSDNQVMDLDNQGKENGTNIKVYTDNGNDAQQFEFVATTDGKFYIKTKLLKGSKTLNVYNGYVSEGTNIEQWDCREVLSQQFELIKTKSNKNEKYIEASAEYSSNGKYQTKIIDTNGSSIQYVYDEKTGNNTKIIDQNQKESNYTYDINNNIKTASKTVNDVLYKVEYNYNNDRLSSIKRNGYSFNFNYDQFGNLSNSCINDKSIVTNTYESNNGNLSKRLFGNNQELTYNYDRFNRLIRISGSRGYYAYSYDAKSNIKSIQDTYNNTTEKYTYDLSNRLIKSENTGGLNIEYTYDSNSNINKKKSTLNGTTNETKIEFDADNKNTGIQLSNNSRIINNYDRLSRINQKNIYESEKNYTINYEYIDINSRKTTGNVKSIKNGNNPKLIYTYDSKGNIETISDENQILCKYYYDELNQLIREDNKELNKTVTYSYNAGGNIISKKNYNYTTDTLPEPTNVVSYEYDTEFKDKLIKYNGNTLSYDGIGNLTLYKNFIYMWENGNKLHLVTNTDNNNVTEYMYNSNGFRTQKRTNGKLVSKFHLESDKVIYEETNGKTIYYTYDGNDKLVGLKIGDKQYYYIRNAQDDIIGILDNNLNQVVSYTYDSWGNIVSIKDESGKDISNDTSNIGNINPYRFKGYRYDSETGLYYLNARYYNPEIGRFISFDNYAGTIGEILSHNGYAYCKNNPINMIDENGKFSITAGSVMAIVGLIIVTIIVSTQPELVNNCTETVGSFVSAVAEQVDKIYTNVINTTTTTTRIKNRKNKENDDYKYFEASLVSGNVVVGKNITPAEAKVRVTLRKDIMCSDYYAAKKIAIEMNMETKPEIDKNRKEGCTYYYHFHNKGEHGSPHVWFYGNP